MVSDGANGIMIALGAMRVASRRGSRSSLVCRRGAGGWRRRKHDVEMRGVRWRSTRRSGSPISRCRLDAVGESLSLGAVALRRRRRRTTTRAAGACVRFDDKGAAPTLVRYENVDARFVVPLLPYPHGRTLSPFDKLNLMLAEYSRNGVELSLQDENSEYGYASDARALQRRRGVSLRGRQGACPIRARGPSAWRWSTIACSPGCGS